MKYSKLELTKNIFTPSGDSIIKTRQLRIDEEGHQYLAITGTKDIQAEIDSYRDSCDLNLVVSQLMNSGIDPSSIAVNIDEHIIDDVSIIPRNDIHEVIRVGRKQKENESLIKKYEEEIKKLKEANEKEGGNNE